MNLKNIWRVHVPKRVAKETSRFPLEDQRRIEKILRDFEFDPWGGDIVKIKGEYNEWRRRIGNYRVFYSINRGTKIVEIKDIERRTTKTYGKR